MVVPKETMKNFYFFLQGRITDNFSATSRLYWSFLGVDYLNWFRFRFCLLISKIICLVSRIWITYSFFKIKITKLIFVISIARVLLYLYFTWFQFRFGLLISSSITCLIARIWTTFLFSKIWIRSPISLMRFDRVFFVMFITHEIFLFKDHDSTFWIASDYRGCRA